MLNASHYLATETLPNGLRLLIRATEPHDDLAGAIAAIIFMGVVGAGGDALPIAARPKPHFPFSKPGVPKSTSPSAGSRRAPQGGITRVDNREKVLRPRSSLSTRRTAKCE